jgi:hypothetical protein
MRSLCIFICFAISFSLFAQQAGCIYQAPYFEPFAHNQPWRLNIGFSNTEDTCWQKFPAEDSLGFKWNLGFNGGGGGYANPYNFNDSSGHRLYKSGNHYVFYVKPAHQGFIGSIPIAKSYLTTSFLKVDSLNHPEFSFDYHMVGSDIRKLIIQYREYGDTIWHSIDSLVGEQQNNVADHLKRHFIDVNFQSDTVRFRFVAVNTGGENCNTLIDNIALNEAETCPSPNRPQFVEITSTSAKLIFDKRNISGATHIKYGDAGVRANSPLLKSITVAGDTALISGLTPGKIYYVYFGAACGSSNISLSAHPIILRLPCNVIFDFPYKENFDDWMGDTIQYFNSNFQYTGVLSSCWNDNGTKSNVKISSWTAGKRAPTAKPLPDVDRSGSGNYLMQKHDFNNQHYLASPKIDLSNSVRPQLSYWQHAHSQTATTFYVELNRGQVWIKVDSLQTPTQSSSADAWIRRVVDLTNYKNDTVQLRFYTTNTSYQDPALVSLDEISIIEKPGCALAGKDSNVAICPTENRFALGILLDSMAYGGSWMDLNNSGAMSAGQIVDLTMLQIDSAYQFRYAIPADSNCTADSATFTIIRSQAFCDIGINKLKNPDFKIFPNPAQGRINIEYGAAEKISGIKIYSLAGKRVFSAAKQVNEIGIENWAPGLYLLQITTDKGVYGRRFVKE